MKRSGRGRGSHGRVEAARRQAALALGRDPDRRGSFLEAAEGELGVLSIGEAPARLGMSRSQVEGMIARGLVEALATDFTRMIPTSEVERLQAMR